MSYDVYIGTADLNITSNMARFFRDFGVYPPDWDGRNRKQVAAEIDAALEKISACDPDELAAEYDDPNGWGSAPIAVEWLQRVAAEGHYEMPDTVQVSW